MPKRKDERHRYGQHYTPPDAALLLAAFGVTHPRDLVFDPACGDGRLLAASVRLKSYLSRQRGDSAEGLAADAFGVDRSRRAIELAARTGALVREADFFDLEPGARISESVKLPEGFDLVIANPPYIRQEVLGSRAKRRVHERLAKDRAALPEINWPRWSGRSDVYVYFFARSIRFLKPGGRLAFLTASSWLDAGYGAALREFLLNNFRVIAVVESIAESFFADASINTSIAVLEREPDPAARQTNQARFVQLKKTLGEITHNTEAGAIRLARSIEQSFDSNVTDSFRIRAIDQAALEGQSPGWGRYLRAEPVLFRVIERGSNNLRSLSSFARVRFGVKTGANDFFYLKDKSEREDRKQKLEGKLLSLNDVASVRRGLTTGANEFFYLKPVDRRMEKQNGNAHVTRRPKDRGAQRDSLTQVEDATGGRRAIESRFLSPVVFSLKEICAIALERAGSTRLFFNCQLAPADLRGTRALSYIRSGERAGYNLRPTCAARERWYSVAARWKPAPLIFPSKVGERWLVALNLGGVFEDKKLYGIFPRRKVSQAVLAALLNSTWARYYAETNCRQMTGAQAIADIDVAVAEQILLPDPRKLAPGLKKKLGAALMTLANRPVLSIFEEIKMRDRRKLDELVLTAIGFANRGERLEVLEQLYKAVTDLVRARLAKTVNRKS